ncbi:hypothetical protein [Streptomyces sp. NPDC003857]
MPRQLDQLPADSTTLARKVQALERQVAELRAARRLDSATIGLIKTAADGARVEISQDAQALRVYATDGTLLAELGPESSGGGGLWTRGLQDPYNMSAFLGSGELAFRPVENGLVDTPASVTYDTDSTQYADLILTSGNLAPTDKPARILLETVFAGGDPYVYVTGAQSNQCNMDVNGIFTSLNIAYGVVSITPSAANIPTSVPVSGLGLKGTNFYAQATASTSAVGTSVTGVGATNVSANGVTVWLTRSSTVATPVFWMVVGS